MVLCPQGFLFATINSVFMSKKGVFVISYSPNTLNLGLYQFMTGETVGQKQIAIKNLPTPPLPDKINRRLRASIRTIYLCRVVTF